MHRLAAITVFSLLLLVAHQSVAVSQPKSAPLLEYSFSGTGKPGASGREFMQVMAHPEVQRVLLDIAGEPRDRAWVQEGTAANGTGCYDEMA